MKVKLLVAIIVMLLLSFIPTTIIMAESDSPLPFLPDQNGTSTNSKDMDESARLIGEDINAYAPEMGQILTIVFVIMFLIGIIKLSYALITKTGFVLKGSTGLLIFVPVFYLLIRLFFIFAFTTSKPSVTLILVDLVNLLTIIGFYAAIGMVLIGLIMRLFNKLLNHPEFARWSKSLFLLSGVLVILTAIVPPVLQNI